MHGVLDRLNEGTGLSRAGLTRHHCMSQRDNQVLDTKGVDAEISSVGIPAPCRSPSGLAAAPYCIAWLWRTLPAESQRAWTEDTSHPYAFMAIFHACSASNLAINAATWLTDTGRLPVVLRCATIAAASILLLSVAAPTIGVHLYGPRYPERRPLLLNSGVLAYSLCIAFLSFFYELAPIKYMPFGGNRFVFLVAVGVQAFTILLSGICASLPWESPLRQASLWYPLAICTLRTMRLVDMVRCLQLILVDEYLILCRTTIYDQSVLFTLCCRCVNHGAQLLVC